MRTVSRVAKLLAAGRLAAAQGCTYSHGTTATYDLSDLVRKGSQYSYVVTDGDVPCTPEVEQNFTWVFNVCDSVTSSSVPASCQGSPAAVYQIDKHGTLAISDDDLCYVAGNYDADSSWSLYESGNPAGGVKLSYTNGDTCGSGASAVKRQTDIIFTCADRSSVNPTSAYEESHCHYTITVPTWYGCPTECPVSGRRLCAGNGHCAYDTDAKASRCFCDNGWGGADCATKSSSSHSSSSSAASDAITGIIITMFVISLGMGVVLFLLVRQVKAYKQDASNYMSLQGGGDFDETTAGV